MINRLKLNLYTGSQQHPHSSDPYPSNSSSAARQWLEQNRLYIEDKELREFWDSCTLAEMEEILTIRNQKVIEYVWSYINYFITNKKGISHKEVYHVNYKRNPDPTTNNNSYNNSNTNPNSNANTNTNTNTSNEDILMYCYDCKIFRNNMFSSEDNGMFGLFLLCCRLPLEGDEELCCDMLRDGNPNNPSNQHKIAQIYEFINPNLHNTPSPFNPTPHCHPHSPQNKILLKCKSSHLLKFYPLLKQLHLQPINGDTILLPQQHTQKFLYTWTQFYSHTWDIDNMVRHLFRGLLIILQNRIAWLYVQQMSEAEREGRRYGRPVVVYEKPKLKESYTMIEDEESLGDVDWGSLRVTGFKIKYKVVEDQNRYVCYRVKDQVMNIDDIQTTYDQLGTHTYSPIPTTQTTYPNPYPYPYPQPTQNPSSGVCIFIDPDHHFSDQTSNEDLSIEKCQIQEQMREREEENMKIFEAFRLEWMRSMGLGVGVGMGMGMGMGGVMGGGMGMDGMGMDGMEMGEYMGNNMENIGMFNSNRLSSKNSNTHYAQSDIIKQTKPTSTTIKRQSSKF